MPRIPHLVSLSFPESIRVLLQRASDQLRLGPQVGRQESVGVRDSGKSSLQCVLESLGRTGRRGVGILDTGKL